MWSEQVSPMGGYRPGHSLLHRVDPRAKLLLVLVLIVAAFARPDLLRMVLLSLTALAGARLAGIESSLLLQRLRPLRWLLLFTLLLHTFFSPGHTLFGLGWLSREGLLRGILTAWGLALALLFSSLLTLATPPEQLAASLARLLKPLERLGVPVAAAAEQVLLVLYFIPILQQEAGAANRTAPAGGSGWTGRLERARQVLVSLVERLAVHAEELAAGAAAGGTILASPAPLSPVRCWGRGEWLLLTLGGLFLGLMVAGGP